MERDNSNHKIYRQGTQVNTALSCRIKARKVLVFFARRRRGGRNESPLMHAFHLRRRGCDRERTPPHARFITTTTLKIWINVGIWLHIPPGALSWIRMFCGRRGDTCLLIRSWERSYRNQTFSILSNNAMSSSHTSRRRFLRLQKDVQCTKINPI